MVLNAEVMAALGSAFFLTRSHGNPMKRGYFSQTVGCSSVVLCLSGTWTLWVS